MRPNEKIEIEIETASERDTQNLITAMEGGEDIRLAKGLTRPVQKEITTLATSSPDGTNLRIVVGAWRDEEGEDEDGEGEDEDGEWIDDDDLDDHGDLDEDEDLEDEEEDSDVVLPGVRDPARVARQVAELFKAVRRYGDVTLTTHIGVETEGGGLVHLVEVEAYLD